MTSSIDIIGQNGNISHAEDLERESNPTTSSLTSAQQRQAAIETGLCSDGRPCGEVHEFCQDAYCADCPNEPCETALSSQNGTKNGFRDEKKLHENQSEQSLDMGTKYDSDKPRMDLIPPHAELLLAQVLTYGANKYASDNWRKVDNASQRYLAAALRHINSHRQGEVIDPESGLPHLAHAMCSLAFILEIGPCSDQ